MSILGGGYRWDSVLLVALLVLLTSTLCGSLSFAVEGQLAFPGAEGFGRFALGGRGGAVYEVTNLQDYSLGATPIAGSLRKGVEDSSGPRTIVFRVGGVIQLKDDMLVKNGFLTIAGQTAPGDGIVLINGGLRINASNVIVRHMRVRRGGNTGKWYDSLNAQIDPKYGLADIIIDHSSFSWGSDETADIGGLRNVTLQWSIISEGLMNTPDSKKADHSKGLLVAWQANNLSIHHNIFAHNLRRNPYLEGVVGADASGDASYNVINNVAYNYESGSGLLPTEGPIITNFIGNYYKPGSANKQTYGRGILVFGTNNPLTTIDYVNGSRIYVKGNIDEWHRPNNSLPESDIISQEMGGWTNGQIVANLIGDPPQVTTTDAFQAYNDVLPAAGATLPKRDAIDSRIVSEVKNRTGRLRQTVEDAGGFPNFPTVYRDSNYDTDHDGMPNAWETQFGFNPNDPKDGVVDANGDGFTNLEEFLNGTRPANAVTTPAGIKVDVTK